MRPASADRPPGHREPPLGLLIVGRRHLEQVPRAYVQHSNQHRPAGRWAGKRRTRPPGGPSLPGSCPTGCADRTCSAAWLVGIDKLHERDMRTPHWSLGRQRPGVGHAPVDPATQVVVFGVPLGADHEPSAHWPARKIEWPCARLGQGIP
jgi:hypothetical protein